MSGPVQRSNLLHRGRARVDPKGRALGRRETAINGLHGYLDELDRIDGVDEDVGAGTGHGNPCGVDELDGEHPQPGARYLDLTFDGQVERIPQRGCMR